MIRIRYFLIFFVLMSISADAKPLFLWSQVVDNDQLSIRAVISEEEQCPMVKVNGKELEMNVRALPLKGLFNDKVCELLVPQITNEISIDNIKIPVINKKIRKIAVIGDTGCIVSFWNGKLNEQHCTSSDKWPLKRILHHVSEHNPDLVIHVGDYLYRVDKCIHVENCGTINGYNSDTWRADWLEASTLLSGKAPFLFVRGNHENCDRAYIGWFRYLASHENLNDGDKCKEFTDSWMFNATKLDSKNIDFYVFDSSFGNEKNVSDLEIENLKQQFLSLLRNKSSSIWFLTHRPLWSYSALMKGDVYYGNTPQVRAFGDLFPNNVSAILSGHVHLSQVLDLRSLQHKHIPMQIIVGNSGALLYSVPEDKLLVKNVKIGNVIADTVKSELGFGFALIEIQESNETDNTLITFYNQFNEKVREFYINK
ncbi:metallophosphoesterase [Ehrlichia sp. JZT12]